MDLDDYCIKTTEPKHTQDLYTSGSNTQIREISESEESSDEELSIKYIIENCPPIKVVKEFFEYLLEDDDELPDFLKK